MAYVVIIMLVSGYIVGVSNYLDFPKGTSRPRSVHKVINISSLCSGVSLLRHLQEV